MRFTNNRLGKNINFDEKTQGKICGNRQNSDSKLMLNSAQTLCPETLNFDKFYFFHHFQDLRS